MVLQQVHGIYRLRAAKGSCSCSGFRVQVYGDRTCRFGFRASGKIPLQTAVKPQKGPFIESKYVDVYVYMYVQHGFTGLLEKLGALPPQTIMAHQTCPAKPTVPHDRT